MPEAGPAIRLLQLTLKNIHGENGIFFLNAKGLLCATQRVTLTNVSEILQATNVLSNIKVKSSMEDGFNPSMPPSSFFVRPLRITKNKFFCNYSWG